MQQNGQNTELNINTLAASLSNAQALADFSNEVQQAAAPAIPEYSPPAGLSTVGSKPSKNVDDFVGQVLPMAQKVSEKTGAPVDAIIGQWGLETGWGKSVIPGTNNLGNIKDFSGRGVSAKDNMTGSVDKYRAYENGDAFADDFVGLLGKDRYRNVLGTKDAGSYFTALKQGGYAEDPDYIRKGVAAAGMASAALAKLKPAAQEQSIPTWAELASKPEFAAMSAQQQRGAKEAYFDTFIQPHAGSDADALRTQFLSDLPPLAQDPAAATAAPTETGQAAFGVFPHMQRKKPQLPADPAAQAGSVLTRENIQANSPTLANNAGGIPLRPEMRQAVQGAWDAATPEQRKILESQDSWQGLVARQRAEQMGAVDARRDQEALAPAPLDTRAEARRERLMRAGEQAAFAETMGNDAARKGLPAGKELLANPTIGNSDFDFETAKLFNPNQPGNGVNNAAVRGIAKAALGIGQTALGLSQFAADVAGADDLAKDFASANNKLIGQKTAAIGERGDMMARNLEGAINSIGQQLPLLMGGAAIKGGQALVLGGIAAQSFGQEYAEGREKKLTVADATKRAGLFAAFEVIGERFGLGHQLDALRGAAKGMPSDQIAGLLFHALSKEVPGEVLTTSGQFATDKFTQMGLNRGATFNDYLGQVADTIVQTLMQGGIMAGGTSGVGKVTSFLTEKGPSERIMEAEAMKAKDKALTAWAQFGQLGHPSEDTAAPVRVAPTGDGRVEPVLEAEPAAEAASVAQPPAELAQQSTTADAPVGQLDTEAVLSLASSRYQTLRTKRDGEVVQDADGSYVEEGGEQLTPAELNELRVLEQHRGDPAALAAFYGLDQQAAQAQGQPQQEALPAPEAVESPQEAATPEAAYDASDAADRAAYDWATQQEQVAPVDEDPDLDIGDPLSGESNVSQAEAMRSLGFPEAEISGEARPASAQPVTESAPGSATASVTEQGKPLPVRARWDALGQQARAALLMQAGSGITQAEADKVAVTPGKKLTQRRLDLVKDALGAADRTGADAQGQSIGDEIATKAVRQNAVDNTETVVAPVEKVPARKKTKPLTAKQRQAATAEYFTPGNIVESYGGGTDRVISYVPQSDTASAKVSVRAVRKQGDAWVDVPNEQRRQHSTMPSRKELERGPVERAKVQESANPPANDGATIRPSEQAEVSSTPQPDSSYGAANKLVTADRAAELRERLKKKLGQLNSGIDPEMLAIGTELAVFHIEAGARKFADFAQAIARDLDTPVSKIRPFLRGWYNGARDMMEDSNLSIEGMDSSETVRAELAKLQDTPTQAQDNASSTRPDLEPDSTQPAAGSVLAGGDERGSGRDGQADRVEGGRVRGEVHDGQQRDSGVPDRGAAPDGERGDQRVHTGDGLSELAGIATGSGFRERGSDVGIGGIPPDSIPAATVAGSAASGLEAAKARTSQRGALSTPISRGIQNVRDTLPSLLPGQQDDVVKAEARFDKPDGYGMLFTNGTGTGKTFTGLGVISRQVRQGKDNILVVVPDEKVLNDWIESGKRLNISITALADTKDAGRGVVVTTYANVGQNNQLSTRDWDLVVADEAQKLMQSEDAKETDALRMVRALTLHPDGAWTRHRAKNADKLEEVRRLSEERKAAEEAGDKAVNVSRLQEKIDDLNKELRDLYEQEKAFVAANQGERRPRALFLSATPFAYEKTVDWANGYLFEYPQAEGAAYNSGNGREQFMMQHFGYRMRYNKLTAPEAGVDSGLMQRNFNTWLKREGVLSSRVLDVAADYDRRFVLIDSDLGNRIDAVFQWMDEQGRAEGNDPRTYQNLSKLIRGSFDYLSRRYLLEAIKAEHSIPYVRKQLEMGRKVVVFHDYKKGGGFNPFNVSVEQFGEYGSLTVDQRAALAGAVSEFRREFKDLLSSGLENMLSPIEAYKRAFGDQVMPVNGDEKAKAMLERYKKFNNDSELPAVLLVQSAKNAGWSGHDTTGKYQRVLVNLGQPSAPTMAIQQEGRIYRTGQVSDAIIRYFNTGTSWEKHTFAGTIAGRASAAENLSLGEEARALKDSFIQAFEESDYYEPGHEGEGKGGKARDRQINGALTEWDRAKAYYFGTQKKNAKTKAQEGKDYFATPEPVGLKMVQWADMRPGDDALEPSAGHGAIARWFPDAVKRTVVEPSSTLRARLALNINPAEDRVVDGVFEDLAKSNKFDSIVMNPPFGVGGKTAMEHVAKAWGHLRDGGRLVALIPTGPAADKRLNDWLYGANDKGDSLVPDAVLMADVALPRVAFERAGTAVAARIVVLEKQGSEEKRAAYGSARHINLTAVDSVADLFDRLEDIGLPARAKEMPSVADQAKVVAESKRGSAAPANKTWRGDEPIEAYVTKRGKVLHGVWRAGLTKEQAQSADPYTWNKGGKWFIRQEHLSEAVEAPKFSRKDSDANPENSTPDLSPDTQRAVDALNDGLGGDFGNARLVEGRRTVGDESLLSLAQSLGLPVIQVQIRPTERAPLNSRGEAVDFNGVTYKGAIYLNVDSQRPHIAVLGHEFAHILAKTNPALYDRLLDAIEPYIKEHELETKFFGSDVAPNHLQPHQQIEEFVGEVFSDGFMDPDFWRAVGKSNKQLLVQVQMAVARLIQKALTTLGYSKRTDRFVTDFKAVMEIAGQVMGEYHLNQARLNKQAGIDPNFNRKDGVRRFLDGAPVASTKGDEFAPDGQKLTDKVPQWFRDRGQQVIQVEGIGAVQLDERAVKSSISHGISRDKANAFAAVPDVLSKGKIIHSEPMDGSRGAGMVYYIAAPVNLAGKEMIEIALVKSDDHASRLYVHEVVLKEKLQQGAFKTRGDTAEAGDHTGAKNNVGAIRSVLQNIYQGNGQPSAQDVKQTDTAAFKRWFGESKVVDGEGEPMVVYHGSPEVFTEFSDEFSGEGDGNTDWGTGFYFASARAAAETYTQGSGNVMEVYLSIQNPAPRSVVERVMDQPGAEMDTEHVRDTLTKMGYDGIIIEHKGGEKEIVAFRPEQIKSAIGNNGDFDRANADIRFNRKDSSQEPAGIAESASGKAIEAVAQPARFKSFNWYDKSLSTQYNKALKDKHFGKVFGLINAQQSAVSLTALRPSELAPMVLPKVDGVAEAFKQLVMGQGDKSPVGKASAALFAGTLAGENVMDGKVFTEAELRSKFKMDDLAVAAYSQARAAIDASLMEVAAAEAYAIAGSYLPEGARRSVMDNPAQAKDLILGEFDKQIDTSTKAMEGMALRDPDIAASIGAQITRMQESRTKVGQIFATAENLAKAGYAPLMRFGDYTVTVTALDVDGQIAYDAEGNRQTVLFEKFETQAEANAALKAARRKYPATQYLTEHGHDSKRSHELLQGITPETVALFADIVGFDTVTQKYYEAALSERSALKRRLERKGTPGYSTDLPRVLSSFITSNARLASQRYFSRDINNAIRYIPQAKGDVRDEAIALRKFMSDNNDGGAMASSLAFAWFLGGNVASAIVNMTQPVMMTAPYLVQFGNPVPHLTKALPYAMGRKQIADAELRAALKRASQEGIVDAQEIFHLYSAGTRGLSAKLVSLAAKVPGLGDKVQAGGDSARARAQAFFTLWGSMFAAAEGFNRRLSFIAAYNMAKEQGQKDPYAFAVRAVNQTQGIYNKVSRPNLARSTVGRLLFTFKQYSLTYLELLNRMYRAGPDGKRAALTMLAVLILASGEEGLPFAQDLDDLIDTAGQMMGFNTNMKRNKRDWAYSMLGKTFGDLALYGVSAQLPLDFSGRLGLGNLIPGTGALRPSNSDSMKSRESTEVLGPIFSLVGQASDAVGAMDEGNAGKAALNLAPTAVRNAAAGVEIMTKGYNTDTRGRKVMDLPKSAGVTKLLGFNPTANAEKSRSTGPLMQDAALLRKRQGQIAGKLTQAVVDNDQKALDAALAERDKWNDRYPDTPIVINPSTIKSRAKQAQTDKDMRVLKSVPKTMRAQAVNSLAGAEQP
ncbi:MAG: PLxRFG domain-containing protein [Comamonas sp.]|uniref:PLxRFG domain-containing protein n=1 Tax=Comamonas sp. TaxID=34028 RepID=UPI003D147D3D